MSLKGKYKYSKIMTTTTTKTWEIIVAKSQTNKNEAMLT